MIVCTDRENMVALMCFALYVRSIKGTVVIKWVNVTVTDGMVCVQ